MENSSNKKMEELFDTILNTWKENNEGKFISNVFLWLNEVEENPFAANDPAHEVFFRTAKYYWRWQSRGIDARRSRIKCIRYAKELFALNPANPYLKEEEATHEEKVIEETVIEEDQEVKQETENKAEEVKIETEEAKEVIEDSQPVEKTQEQIHVFGVVPENTAEIEENFAEKSPEAKREQSVNNKPQSYNPNAKPPFFGKRKR